MKAGDIVQITSSAMCVCGSYLWASVNGFNGLFKTSLTSGKMEFVGKFIGQNDEDIYLHSQIIVYKEKLFFVPNFSDGIDIYDFKNNVFSKIMLPESINTYRPPGTKMFAAHRVDMTLIMFGMFSACIIFLDLDKEIVEKVSDMSYLVKDCSKPLFGKTIAKLNDELLLPFYQNNMLFRMNLDNRVEILDVKREIYSVCSDADSAWIISKGKIYKLAASGIIDEIELPYNYIYPYCVRIADMIYLCSNENDELIIVETKNRKTLKLKIDRHDTCILRNYDGVERFYNGIIIHDEEGLLISDIDNSIYRLKGGKVIDSRNLCIENVDEFITELLIKRIFGDALICCEKNDSLKQWLALM